MNALLYNFSICNTYVGNIFHLISPLQDFVPFIANPNSKYVFLFKGSFGFESHHSIYGAGRNVIVLALGLFA